VGNDDFAAPQGACGRPAQPDQIKDVRRICRISKLFFSVLDSIVAGACAGIRVFQGAGEVKRELPTWCGKAP
jgi:hypothetical protein